MSIHTDDADFHGEPAQVQHVAICIITNNRPAGLARLLASLVGQAVDRRDIYPRIIIASNGTGHRLATEQVVAAFTARSPFPIEFVHDDTPGIARARNTACRLAMVHQCDWIAFIDDDEAAGRNWLASIMAPEYRKHAVMIGRREWIYPTPRPFWAPDKERKYAQEGGPAKLLTTANVRFSVELLKAGLRFDESMGLAGGSDQRFFQDAKRQGFDVHVTNKAIAWEYAHVTRMTYRFMIARHYAHLASLTHTKIRERGRRRVLFVIAPVLAKAMILAPLELAAAPIAALFSRRRFKQFALRGGKRYAEAFGVVVAFAGHLPQVYATIHGE
jgi:glycosyltransferase involved in cell wall biosynthesis